MEENQKTDKTPETFQYSVPQSDPASNDKPAPASSEDLSWTSVEFIGHKKNFLWFLICFIILVLVGAGVYFVVHSIFAVVMIGLIGLSFVIIAVRSPRNITYQLSNNGIQMGNKFISFSEFKSFSVIDENTLGSVTFNPFKRFAFPTTIYFEKDIGERILNYLTDYLPHEEVSTDPVDLLMRKLHF